MVAPSQAGRHCFMEGRPGWGPCEGRMDAAHLIPKQRIKRELKGHYTEPELQAIVWDRRVLIDACRRHHHQLDNYIHRLRRDELPVELTAYAREYHLVWSLIRDYR